MKTLKINNKQYLPKETQKPIMSKIAGLAMMSGLGMRDIKEKERPDIGGWTVKEFELIQQKKSRLSKSQRDWVESVFYSNFKEVTENEIAVIEKQNEDARKRHEELVKLAAGKRIIVVK